MIMRAPLGSSVAVRIPESMNKRRGPERLGIDLSKIENHLLEEELDDIWQSDGGQRTLSQDASGSSHDTGNMMLLDCLARLFNNYFTPNMPVAATHIAPSAGDERALDTLLQTICQEGDGILIPGPRWFDFDPECWSSRSIETIAVDLPNFTDNLTRKLIAALSDAVDRSTCRVRALLLSNPHVSFGQCYPQEVLEACLKFCEQRDIHYISDETYALTEFPCAEMSSPVSFFSALSLDARLLGCNRSRIHTLWSVGKSFGAGKFQMGCTISQGNSSFVAKLTEAYKSQVTTTSIGFTTMLLSSHGLPFMITINSARLAESYIRVTTFFLRHGIKYIPANIGLSIFARMAPRAKTWEDEAAMITKLKDAGVLVYAGQQLAGVQREKGWARLTFSLQEDKLEEALRRIEVALVSR